MLKHIFSSVGAFVIVLSFLSPAVLWAGPEDELIRREILLYHAVRRIASPPGELIASLEDLQLADEVLSREPFPGETLSYEGYLKVARELTRVYGYRFSDPPFTREDYGKLIEARRSREGVFPAETKLYRGMRAEINERVRVARQEVPSPQVRLTFPPPLKASDFPVSVTGYKAGATQLDISMTQASDGFNRLADAFQIMATTPTGRELLADFLPMLRQGNIAIQPLTPEIVRRWQTRSGLAPAAMWAYDPATGKMTIYADPKAETGMLVEHLVHEIAHATDKRNLAMTRELLAKQEQARIKLFRFLEEVAKRRGISAHQVEFRHLDQDGMVALERLYRDLEPSSQRETFLAELHAYAIGDKFRAELATNFPEAGKYYDAKFQRSLGLPSTVSAEYIYLAYGMTEFRLGMPPCKKAALLLSEG